MTESPHRPYYPALDGLRGVAIILVIALHNFNFNNYFFFGWLGVDLFFVLSGFLITGILLNSMGERKAIGNFYMRRILRIFPVYYLALFICLLVIPLLVKPEPNLEYYRENLFWLLTYLQNWLFIFKEPYGDQLLLHTWSLAIEEQYYLLWPAIIILVKNPRRLLSMLITFLVLIIIGRPIIWLSGTGDFSYATLYTYTRVDGLVVGSMLALILRIKPDFPAKFSTILVLFLAALNFAFYFLSLEIMDLPYLAFTGYTTIAFLFGLIVYEAVKGDSRIIHFVLNRSALKFLGRISYGLYVYHWPLYLLLAPRLALLLSVRGYLSDGYAVSASAIATTILAIFISWLSYRYLEKPFLALKNRFGKSVLSNN